MYFLSTKAYQSPRSRRATTEGGKLSSWHFRMALWCVVYTTYNAISLQRPEGIRTLPDMRRYSSATVWLLSSALDSLAPFTCLSPSHRSLGVSGGGPWGLIDVIVSLDSTQSSRISRPKPPVLLPPIRDRGMWCLRLPGYVRGMASLLGSPRRSRRGGTTAYWE
jgi:hypothetical protein